MFQLMLRDFSEKVLAKLVPDPFDRERIRRHLKGFKIQMPEDGSPAAVPRSPSQRPSGRTGVGPAALVLLSATLALPARADVSPLKIGNTWVYQGRAYATNYWGGPQYYRQFESLTAKVTDRKTAPGGALITVGMKDSLSHRAAYFRADPDTLILRDTVVAWTLTLLEKGDSLTVASVAGLDAWRQRDRNVPPTVPAILEYNAFFRLHSHPHGTYAPLAGANRTAWSNEIHDSPIFGAGAVRGWYVDDVGMLTTAINGGGGCDGYMERALYLVTFNGKEVDIGISPIPVNGPLAKEAKAACSLIRPARGRLSIVRNGAAQDLLGRALAVMGARP